MLQFAIQALPLAIVALVISSVLNTNRLVEYDDPLISVAVHVLFQTVLICSLMEALRKHRIVRTVLAVLIAFAVFLQLGYGSSLSVSIVMSVANSSIEESLSFIQFNVMPLLATGILLVGLLVFRLPDPGPALRATFIMVSLSYLLIPTMISDDISPKSQIYQGHMESALARGHTQTTAYMELVVQHMSPRFPPLDILRGVTDTISLFVLQSDTVSSWSGVSATGAAPLLVVGIGESLRADNLGIYGYERETTPRLAEIREKLSIYEKSYSAGTNTWTSVPAALTITKTRPDLSKSIINLANDAGYTTYWLSNQARYSEWDLPCLRLPSRQIACFSFLRLMRVPNSMLT